MGKGLKIFLIAAAALAVAFTLCTALFFFLFEYNNEYRLTNIDHALSPDGRYSASLQMVGQPDWPFGAATAKVTVEETASGRVIKVFETNIHDDGCALSPGHWKVEWAADAVYITLSGSEMQARTHTVTLP